MGVFSYQPIISQDIAGFKKVDEAMLAQGIA